jgi:signal transduction histidine kinase
MTDEPSRPSERTSPRQHLIASRVRADERRRIARDLHDGTSQLLTLMQLKLGQLKRAGDDGVAPLLEECERAIQEIRNEIRCFYRD